MTHHHVIIEVINENGTKWRIVRELNTNNYILENMDINNKEYSAQDNGSAKLIFDRFAHQIDENAQKI